MLFLFDFADRASLVIDDDNELQARKVAVDVAAGVQPTQARRLPARLFVAELYAREAENPQDGDVIVLEALPHVLESLGMLLEDEDPATAPTQPAPTHLRVVKPCDSVADAPGGGVVGCELAKGHAGQHTRGDLAWGEA